MTSISSFIVDVNQSINFRADAAELIERAFRENADDRNFFFSKTFLTKSTRRLLITISQKALMLYGATEDNLQRDM